MSARLKRRRPPDWFNWLFYLSEIVHDSLEHIVHRHLLPPATSLLAASCFILFITRLPVPYCLSCHSCLHEQGRTFVLLCPVIAVALFLSYIDLKFCTLLAYFPLT
jgi:hypothetical protein